MVQSDNAAEPYGDVDRAGRLPGRGWPGVGRLPRLDDVHLPQPNNLIKKHFPEVSIRAL